MKEEKHHRHSIRLPKYDYSEVGWYFVTICTQNRECLFGRIENEKMVLNQAGSMIQNWWLKIPDKFPMVELDEFMVMSNHVHGIIVITNDAKKIVGARFIAPVNNDVTPQNKFVNQGAIYYHRRGDATNGGIEGAINCAPTLGHIIRYFKGVTAFVIRKMMPHFQWQRNYHDHIIRNEKSYWAIKEYIRDNPANWTSDEENPVLVRQIR